MRHYRSLLVDMYLLALVRNIDRRDILYKVQAHIASIELYSNLYAYNFHLVSLKI